MSCIGEKGREISLVKDMVICGVAYNKLRERLLREADLTLANAIKLGQAAEETQIHVKQIKTEQEHSVYKIQKTRSEASKSEDILIINNCRFCPYSHPKGKCPAFGKRCNNCKKMNHFANRCLSKKNANVININDRTNRRNESLESSQEYNSLFTDEFIIETLDINPNNDSSAGINKGISGVKSETPSPPEWLLNIKVNETDIEFKLDTGAQCNVIPWNIYKTLIVKSTLLPTNATLTGYDNTKIDVCGRCVLSVNFKNKIHKVLFYVVQASRIPLLGLDLCMRLNLLKRLDIIDTY